MSNNARALYLNNGVQKQLQEVDVLLANGMDVFATIPATLNLFSGTNATTTTVNFLNNLTNASTKIINFGTTLGSGDTIHIGGLDSKVDIGGDLEVSGDEVVVGDTIFQGDTQIGDAGTDTLDIQAVVISDINFNGTARAINNTGADLTIKTTTSGNLILSTTTLGNIDLNSAVDVTVDAGAAGTVSIGATTVRPVDLNATTLDIDGTAISIDGTAASNLSTTGANLTVSTLASGTLAVASAGALNLSSTGANITANTGNGIFAVTTAHANQAMSLNTTDSTAAAAVFVGDSAPSGTPAQGSLWIRTGLTPNAALHQYDSAGGWTQFTTSAGSTLQAAYNASSAPAAIVMAVSKNLVFRTSETSTTESDFLVETGIGGDAYLLADASAAKLVLGSINILVDALNTLEFTGTNRIVQSTSGGLTIQTLTSGSLSLNSAGAVDISANATGSFNVTGGQLNLTTAASGDIRIAPASTQDIILSATGVSGDVSIISALGEASLVATAGSATITAGAASVWSTTAGTLAVTGAGALTLSSSGAGVQIQSALNNNVAVVAQGTGDVNISVADNASADINFNAHGSGSIPFNSVAESTLTTTAQNIVGAINELAGAGADTLQEAYNASSDPATILTSGSKSLRFEIASGDFFNIFDASNMVMAVNGGDGNVLLQATENNLDLKTVTSGTLRITAAATLEIWSNAASQITCTGANLTVRTQTSGTLSLVGVGGVNITGSNNTVAIASGTATTTITSQSASSWNNTSGNLTIQTLTSGDLRLQSVGVTRLWGNTLSISGGSGISVASNSGSIGIAAYDSTAGIINFDALSSGNIPFNTTADPNLVGFTKTSIIGALNELKADAGSGLVSSYTANEAVAAGEAVSMGVNGEIYLADSDTLARTKFIGIVKTGAAASGTAEVYIGGEVGGVTILGTTPDAGDYVYLSTTDGDLTVTVPGSGTLLRVGVITAASQILIQIGTPVEL